MGATVQANDFDPFDMTSPDVAWQRLRENSPVFQHQPTGYWVVTRHEDIKAVYQDWETFSSDNAQAPVRPMCEAGRKIMKDGGFTVYSGLSARVPPDHTRIRNILQPAFGPRRFKAIEPKIESIIDASLNAINSDEAIDFYRDIAYPVPALVLFALMGIPDEDVPKVKSWASSRAVLTWGHLSDEEQLPHAHNMVDYWAYCRALVTARKQHPGDDLPSDLLKAQANGEDISDEEIAGVMYSVLFAGHETTTNLMANGLRTLLENRNAWNALVNDASLIKNATEEVLRYSPSIVSWRRRATKETQIGGVSIPAGANILVIMGSGNRDAKIFDNAEAFDIERKNARKHISFGYGIHFCPGYQLAKMEFGIMLRELTNRFPQMQLAEGHETDYLPNISFRVPRSMHVQFNDLQK